MKEYTKQEIFGLFDLLDQEQFNIVHQPLRIVVVGGCWMAMKNLRETTDDVDSVTALPSSLKQAVEHMAANNPHVNSKWLNDSAAMFSPNVTVKDRELETVHESERIQIVLPSPRFVFAMKASSHRASMTDMDDAAKLWELCDFDNTKEAVLYLNDAYPYTLTEKQWEIEVNEIIKHHRRLNTPDIPTRIVPHILPLRKGGLW